MTITATVNPNTPEDYVLDNTASVSSATADPNHVNDSSTTHTTVDTEADLSISKLAPTDTVAGSAAGFDYTLTVHNGGPSDNTGGFTVTDTLQAGLTFQTAGSSADCSAAGQLVTCTNTTGLAANGDQPFTVHVTVASSVPDGTVLANTASVDSDGTTDPNPANTSNTTHTTVHALADLSVSKLAPATATAGAPAGFDYTLTVHNGGPSDNATGYHVTDTLDSGLTFQTAGSSATCSAAGQVVTCLNTTGLAAGADEVFTVHVTLASTVDSGTDLANSATVTSDGTTDPNPANTSNTTHTSVTEDVHLSVAKTFNSATVTAGGAEPRLHGRRHQQRRLRRGQPEPHRYGRRAVGRGLGHGRQLHLPGRRQRSADDHLLAGASRGRRNEVDHGRLPRRLDDEQRSERREHGRRDVRRGLGERHRLGRDRRERVAQRHEDVRLGDGDGRRLAAGVHRGCREHGVSDADNVHLTDLVDSRLIIDSIDAGAYNCTASAGQQVDCSLLHLAAGETQSITVHYHVGSTTNTAASVGNTATAQSDEDGPTTGSDSVAIVENVVLSVTKTFNSDSATAGGAGETFTVSVHNAGSSDADNVSLTDTVDSRLIVTRSRPAATPARTATACADDHLHAGASGGRRHAVDHGRLSRRHGD